MCLSWLFVVASAELELERSAEVVPGDGGEARTIQLIRCSMTSFSSRSFCCVPIGAMSSQVFSISLFFQLKLGPNFQAVPLLGISLATIADPAILASPETSRRKFSRLTAAAFFPADVGRRWKKLICWDLGSLEEMMMWQGILLGGGFKKNAGPPSGTTFT